VDGRLSSAETELGGVDVAWLRWEEEDGRRSERRRLRMRTTMRTCSNPFPALRSASAV
jgi:hypothetical protein